MMMEMERDGEWWPRLRFNKVNNIVYPLTWTNVSDTMYIHHLFKVD